MDLKSKFLKQSAHYVTIKEENPTLGHKLLLRTQSRSENLDDSISFQIHDPLWMLSRQMQLGEFRGNNAGTALSVKCNVKEYTMGYEEPIEYNVERVSPEITPKIMVESALYYMKLSKKNNVAVNIKQLREEYPLCETYVKCGVNDKTVLDFAQKSNDMLCSFLETYKDKAFNGYGLYLKLDKETNLKGIDKTYYDWFKERYITTSNQLWDIHQLGYKDSSQQLKLKGNIKIKKYAGGRLSWYSFDFESNPTNKKIEERTIYSLPILATYAGAPCKRLWQFEDHKVYLGNTNEIHSQGNALFMQFSTMYSNDWMLIPLDTKLGTYIEVSNLEVWDTFGDNFNADNTNTVFDKNKASYDQQWCMFNIAPEQLDTKNLLPGLLLPQVFANIVESDPIEEVHFLRDEMANMVWGVETKIPDGAGYVIDNKAYTETINDFIEQKNQENLTCALGNVADNVLSFNRKENNNTEISASDNYDFSYMIQNRVPLNYIPFVPQHIRKQGSYLDYRETQLRRGKMPCFVYTKEQADKDYYLPVRPVSSLLACKLKADGKEEPLTINEEEILQTGVKIVKTYQHGRWFNGQHYHWLGISKKLNELDANSGLTYDKLKY